MATPHPYGAPAPTAQGNGLAVAGMVTGILAILLCWFWPAAVILGILGIIFGAIGISKANRVGRGKGMAITGIVCGALGIVLAVVFIVVVIAAFTSYAKKSKRSEAQLELHHLERRIKSYQIERGTLPPSASELTPAEQPCASPGGKAGPASRTEWERQAGWRELGFTIDEPTLFQYRWTRSSETRGFGEAVGDLDCDGDAVTYRLDVEIVGGNVEATTHEPVGAD